MMVAKVVSGFVWRTCAEGESCTSLTVICCALPQDVLYRKLCRAANCATLQAVLCCKLHWEASCATLQAGPNSTESQQGMLKSSIWMIPATQA